VQDRPVTGPYRDRSDASLMQATATDPAAFSEIYDRHAGTLYAWFRFRLAWAASDLTAETFARAWLARDRFRDLRGGSALPWLHGIAANVLADAVRRDRIETRARERLGLPLDLASEDGYDDVERRLSPRLAVGRELRGLPEHERQAVELRVLEELPYDQVADRLAIAPAAARLRVSRALRRLAGAVSREDM
jgi:RNA polymerase sigma-70 factor (ECF subfamily)